MKENPIIFAGAGPGDPDLITVKAQNALKDAQIVIYAGSLVPEAVLKWADKKAALINSASMHLDEIVMKMASGHRSGKKVVRLHTGDPSLYGAIFEQMAELDRQSIPYKVIPGVTAAFAAAAAMQMEFTIPEVSQTLIFTRMAGRTPVPEKESLSSLAKHKASMAIYLSISLIDEVQDVLMDAYGADSTCAIAYCVGHPEEKIIFMKVKNLAGRVREENITRQALVIAGQALDFQKSAQENENPPKRKSKLYDSHFSHGFRKSVNE